MYKVLTLVGASLLALSLLACSGAPKSSAGGCEMCSSECMAGKNEAEKKECKAKCEKKEQNHSCCSKGEHKH